jgi:hypothetical protein
VIYFHIYRIESIQKQPALLSLQACADKDFSQLCKFFFALFLLFRIDALPIKNLFLVSSKKSIAIFFFVNKISYSELDFVVMHGGA